MSICIRPAHERDVDDIIDLFYHTYGLSYCYPQVYEQSWQQKRVTDPNWLVLVAEEDQKVCAVAITRFNVMTREDRCGELWISIVNPKYRRRGIGTRLTAYRLALIRGQLNFCYALNVVENDFTQRIQEQNGLLPVGFLPLRDLYTYRYSYTMHSIILPTGRQQRLTNPYIIPEVEALAKQVLHDFGLPKSYSVVNVRKIDPYFQGELVFDSPSNTSWLIVQEVCRQSPRRILGRIDLRNDSESLISRSSHLLVARINGNIVGTVALMIERDNHLLEILDIAGKDLSVVTSIIKEVDRRAATEWQIEYAELNVSTCEPQTQRILHDLGFAPVAYCPAMATFERTIIDVVRMAKVYRLSNIGQLKVTPAARRICEIVFEGFPQLVGTALFTS